MRGPNQGRARAPGCPGLQGGQSHLTWDSKGWADPVQPTTTLQISLLLWTGRRGPRAPGRQDPRLAGLPQGFGAAHWELGQWPSLSWGWVSPSQRRGPQRQGARSTERLAHGQGHGQQGHSREPARPPWPLTQLSPRRHHGQPAGGGPSGSGPRPAFRLSRWRRWRIPETRLPTR